jgi:hypothetical protein
VTKPFLDDLKVKVIKVFKVFTLKTWSLSEGDKCHENLDDFDRF